MKKHNIIYQTTNLLNGKTYIGRHSTDNLDDGYLGSGTILKRAIRKSGRDSFKRIVLFDFPTPEEMIAKEIELLTEEFISSADNYNIGIGQGGLFTHDEDAREKLRLMNIGLVMIRDEDGKCFKIPVDDPRYLSGELKSHMHGMVTVKDETGKKFRVKVDDPRYLSGELVAANKGHKHRPEKGQNHTKIMLEYWKEVGGHSDEAKEKCRAANVGRVTVRDNDGNTFRVPVDDERLVSGELVIVYTGNVWINNVELKKSKFIRPEKVQEFLDLGWKLGLVYFDKKKRFWISNPISQISRQVTEDKLNEFISDGWEIGRIPLENLGAKIKASRQPGSWMINLETGETRIIHKPLVDDHIANGWILGRMVK